MFKRIAIAATLFAAAATQADTVGDSIVFNDSGETIFGSFDKIHNGDSMTGLPEIDATYDGALFLGYDSFLSSAFDSALAGSRRSVMAAPSRPGEVVDQTSPQTHSFLYNQFYAGAVHGGNVTVNAAIPEPETYAMMIAGLGMVGAIARRREAKRRA